jgi:hypothetical protein
VVDFFKWQAKLPGFDLPFLFHPAQLNKKPFFLSVKLPVENIIPESIPESLF